MGEKSEVRQPVISRKRPKFRPENYKAPNFYYYIQLDKKNTVEASMSHKTFKTSADNDFKIYLVSK